MELNPYDPPSSMAATFLKPRRRNCNVPWYYRWRGIGGFIIGFIVANYFFGHPLGMGDDGVLFVICTLTGILLSYCFSRFIPPPMTE